jgi:putative flippase GtrA
MTQSTEAPAGTGTASPPRRDSRSLGGALHTLFAGGWRGAAHILFVRRTENAFVQLFRYGFVGGVGAVVDAGGLFLLTSGLGLHYLISAAISFTVATVVNYLLSIAWVFRSSGRVRQEFALFTLIGVGGLGLTELILWVTVSQIGLNYMVGKLIALGLVMFWSFFLRRLLFSMLNRRAERREAAVAAPAGVA